MLTVDWSQIPADILGQIVDDYLTNVEDYLIICRVCRSWYAIARTFDKSRLRNLWSRQIPLLMLTDGNDTETYRNSNLRTGRSSGYYSFKKPTRNIGRFNAEDYVIGLCDVEDDTYVQSEDDEDDEDDTNEGDMVRCMMSLSKGNNNNNNKCFNVSLPEAYKKACWGSQYGWIVTLGRDRQMSLLNPLTKATLALPSQRTFAFSWKRSSGKTICHRFIHKAVLIRVPRNQRLHGYITRDSPCCAYNDGNIWVVVVIHQRGVLASIAKPGDYLWAPILRPSRNRCSRKLHDVTYCSRLNSLLFVDSDANLLSCSLEDIEHPQVLTQFMNGPLSLKHSIAFGYEIRRYIVEYGDDVLVITRHIVERDYLVVHRIIDGRKAEDFGEFDKYLTFKFEVHKVNFITQNFEELDDLGNCSLFLGNNSTILVPRIHIGCETNSIYFCDDRRWGFHFTRNGVGGHDMGVFRMIDKTIRPFYDGHRSNSSYCCPFWFRRSI